MTNENASRANDDLRAVTENENDRVKGAALAHKSILEDRAAKVAELRQRQQDYEENLPKDPIEALKEINRTLKSINDIHEAGFAARASLEILNEMALQNALEDLEYIRHSISWLTFKGLKGLDDLEAANRHVRHITRQFYPRHEPFEA